MSGCFSISRERGVSTETSKAPTKNNPCKIALLVGGIFIAIAGLAAAGALFPHIGYYSAAIAGGGLVIGVPLAVYAARTLKTTPQQNAATSEKSEVPTRKPRESITQSSLPKPRSPLHPHHGFYDSMQAGQYLVHREGTRYHVYIKGEYSFIRAQGEGQKARIEYKIMTSEEFKAFDDVHHNKCVASDRDAQEQLKPGHFAVRLLYASTEPDKKSIHLFSTNQNGIFESKLITGKALTEFYQTNTKLTGQLIVPRGEQEDKPAAPQSTLPSVNAQSPSPLDALCFSLLREEQYLVLNHDTDSKKVHLYIKKAGGLLEHLEINRVDLPRIDREFPGYGRSDINETTKTFAEYYRRLGSNQYLALLAPIPISDPSFLKNPFYHLYSRDAEGTPCFECCSHPSVSKFIEQHPDYTTPE